MRQRERKSHTLHADELGAGDPLFGLAVSGFLEDLLQRAHLFGFFQEQARFFKVVPPQDAASSSRACATKVRPSLKMRVVN